MADIQIVKGIRSNGQPEHFLFSFPRGVILSAPEARVERDVSVHGLKDELRRVLTLGINQLERGELEQAADAQRTFYNLLERARRESPELYRAYARFLTGRIDVVV